MRDRRPSALPLASAHAFSLLASLQFSVNHRKERYGSNARRCISLPIQPMDKQCKGAFAGIYEMPPIRQSWWWGSCWEAESDRNVSRDDEQLGAHLFRIIFYGCKDKHGPAGICLFFAGWGWITSHYNRMINCSFFVKTEKTPSHYTNDHIIIYGQNKHRTFTTIT